MQRIKLGHILLGILFSIVIFACKPTFKLQWTKEEAPEYFTAKFETNKGVFEIESRKEWSPAGVNRLYQLIKHGYYTDMYIYRVIPGYVAQFGLQNDTLISSQWRNTKISDEPVLKSNTKGTMSFARGGPDTRSTILFINVENNSPRLDTINFNQVVGFPVVAQVISGFDVVASFYNGYGRQLDDKQTFINEGGHNYLKKNYPKLDYIYKAQITGQK